MEPNHTSAMGHADPHTTATTDAQAASKEKNRRLFQRGLKCLGLGILFMAVSFGVNMLLFHSDSDFALAMYTLTSVGAAFILMGLVCLFGFRAARMR